MPGQSSPINSSREISSPRFKLGRLAIQTLLCIVVPLLFFAAIEGGLRHFEVGYSTELLIPCTIGGQPGKCFNLFFVAPFFPAGMIREPRAYGIPADKPSQTYRIFVLGESAAMGDPDPAYAFSRYLEVMLRSRYPSRRFEVVNTGSVAINSHVLLPIARGLADQKPDLFIIYSGNNEVVGPYGPGTVLTGSEMNRPLIRTELFVQSTRTGQLLTRSAAPKREWTGMDMFLDNQVSAYSPLLAKTYSNYESNLRDTIAVARRAGARVLVSTVATNLEDCAPFGSQHGRGLRQEQLNRWNDLVQQGAALEDAGDDAGALRSYQAASAIDAQYAELEFRIARVLTRLAEFSGAKVHFERARDLDTLRFRADSRINEINRSVGASEPGSELVDAEQFLAAESPHGVIGYDLVYEHVHLTPRANYLLARAIFLKITKQLDGAASSDTDVVSQADCERMLALTNFDRDRMMQDILKRLQKAPFTAQMNHADQLAYWSTKANLPPESPQETAAAYQWALSRRPDDRLLHYTFGLFLLQFNRDAAYQQLRLSRAFDGIPVYSPDGVLL